MKLVLMTWMMTCTYHQPQPTRTCLQLNLSDHWSLGQDQRRSEEPPFLPDHLPSTNLTWTSARYGQVACTILPGAPKAITPMERPSIVQPLLPCTPTTLAVPQCTHPEIIFCRSPKVQVHSTSICTRMTIQRKTTLICLLVQPWLLVALLQANAILLLRPYCPLNVSFIFENHTKSLIYSLQFEWTKVP